MRNNADLALAGIVALIVIVMLLAGILAKSL